MASWEIGLLITIVYVCVYGVVNRICKCVETCAAAKSHRVWVANGCPGSEEKKQNM